MPGFIDGHTHLDMPFGGTVTSDDWDTGTAAAVAGGTTTIVDFSLQDIDGTLAEAVDDVAGQGRGQDAHRLRPARGDHQPHRGGQGGDPVAAGARRLDDQDLHGLQGHAALHGRRGPLRGDADRARGRRARARARRERRRHRQAPGPGARRAATPTPHWHALTRPESAEAEATNRAIRLAEIADAPLLVVHVSCAARARGGAPRARARAARSTPRPARSTSSSSTPTSSARTSRAPSTCARRRCATRPTARRCGAGCRPATCRSSAPTTARSTSPARRSSAATTSR